MRMYIYGRKRTAGSLSFLEVFVDFKDKELSWPTERLVRFKGRGVGPETVFGPLTFVPVDSKAPSGVVKRALQSIHKDGAWIAYSDCVPCLGPPTVSSFFGVPIDPLVWADLSRHLRDLYKACPPVWSLDDQWDPYVVYHGTARDSVAPILETGFRPSFGMLGTAVYFGSFWKAFRFATMTQDYAKRPGAILRVFGVWPRMTFRTATDERCACSKCNGRVPLADHHASWSDRGAVLAVPDGSTIANEEYAVQLPLHKDCLLIVDSVAHVEAQTNHHEPRNRSLHIE